MGACFSVNRMLTAECYKQRMERGLSFLEFNYMIMQSYDFYMLYQKYGCNMQFGGDDQWSNMPVSYTHLPATHREVLHNAMGYAAANGFAVRGLDFSPVKGPEGNTESVSYTHLDVYNRQPLCRTGCGPCGGQAWLWLPGGCRGFPSGCTVH